MSLSVLRGRLYDAVFYDGCVELYNGFPIAAPIRAS